MPPETLAALKKSIEHWERLATSTAEDGEGVMSSSCPLCRLFLDKACGGCPVPKKTGRALCSRTPWAYAHAAYMEDGKNSPQFRAAAQKELEFLRSLLPQE